MNFLNIVSKTPIIKSENEDHNKIVQRLKWKNINIPSRVRIEHDIKRIKSFSFCEKPKFEPMLSEEEIFSSEIFTNENYMEKNNFDLYFNEIEMSANAYFKTPVFQENVNSELIVQKFKRFYYDLGSLCFNLNDSQFSSIKLNDSSELSLKLVVRFDVYNDSLIINTNKVVYQQKKFNVRNFVVKLKTSFETLPIEIKHNMFSSPTKVYNIQKWKVILILKNIEYKFIIAFRLTEYEVSNLNIECEDAISFEDFSICFEALYVYYNYQYLFNNKIICPENPDFENFRQSICFENLKSEQQFMLENLEFINETMDYLNLNEKRLEKFKLLDKSHKYFLFYSLKMFFEKNPNLTELTVNSNLFNNLDFVDEKFDETNFKLNDLEMDELLDFNTIDSENEIIETKKFKESDSETETKTDSDLENKSGNDLSTLDQLENKEVDEDFDYDDE